MKLWELLNKSPLFNHLQYVHKPLTDTNLDIQIRIDYGNRTLKPAIEEMMNDPLIDSYLTLIFNTIESMYSDKWDRIRELQTVNITDINGEKTETTSTGADSSTSINSVWGITDSTDQNKEKTTNSGSNNNTTITTKTGNLELDKVNNINNINLVSTMVSDVANYLCLYIVD